MKTKEKELFLATVTELSLKITKALTGLTASVADPVHFFSDTDPDQIVSVEQDGVLGRNCRSEKKRLKPSKS